MLKMLKTILAVTLLLAPLVLGQHRLTLKDWQRTRDCPMLSGQLNTSLTFPISQNFFDSRSKDLSIAGGRILGSPAGPPLPSRNLIDEYIFAKMERDRVASAGVCSDQEFIRRVYLDLTGRIPAPAALREFLAESDTDKRDRLVDRLIATPEFVDRWTLWFGDHLRNTIYPVSTRGRNAIHTFTRAFVNENRPYNQLVSELLIATGDNYLSGPINYLMKAGAAGDLAEVDTIDDMAVATARDFLGIKILCISCHQGAGYLDRINLWLTRKRRDEFWEQAAFFTQMSIDARLTADMMSYRYRVSEGGPGVYDPDLFLYTSFSFRPPRRIVEPVRARYLFSGERPEAGENLRAGLARMITSDIQFARATVNYIWAHFMVKGLVEPTDGFDLARLNPNAPPIGDDAASRYWRETEPIQPSHPELLEALAEEFISARYNLRHILQLICKSSAYQLSSRYDGEWRPHYVNYYARKLPRLLWAEEIHDAVLMATGTRASYSVYGTPQRVQWALQLRGPEEPAGFAVDDSYGFEFLESFKRGDRQLIPRSLNRQSLLQPLSLMHSPFIQARVDASQEGTLARLLSGRLRDYEMVEELFLATLSRYPLPAEKKAALIKLKTADRREALEDLMWSLLNKIDFVFNY